ncbi:uncharacterized protein LOC129730854 [Wyeomyia smithii]|uniref:uncharacterized protein LOC129730854 n=1 Tax=Wyeomyia smithii TaxID=174621 RepID=UPI002467DECA|nr:uncharacterized protein LOC129730854 [Wyeomyia smithii]
MLPIYGVSPSLSPSESIQDDFEGEYIMIRDDESIEVISEPGDSPHCKNSISSSEQEDTDSESVETRFKDNASERAIKNGGVNVDIEDGVRLSVSQNSNVNNKQEFDPIELKQRIVSLSCNALHQIQSTNNYEIGTNYETGKEHVSIGKTDIDNEEMNQEDKRDNVNLEAEQNCDNNGIEAILEENEKINYDGVAVNQIPSEIVVVEETVKVLEVERLTEVVQYQFMDAQRKENECKTENHTMLNEHLKVQHEEESEMLARCLNEIRIFRNGHEYVKKKNPTQIKVDQLGFSARISYENLDIKLHNEGSLMTADDNFLAVVRIIRPSLVDQTASFMEAREAVLQQLRIVQVLRDDLMAERKVRKQSVLEAIRTVLEPSSEDEGFAVDRIQLFFIMNNDDCLTFANLCEKIKNNQFMCENLRRRAGWFLQAEARSIARDSMLSRFDHRQPETFSVKLINQLRETLNDCSSNYRKQLLEKAPTCLHDTLGNISDDRILFIRAADIKLFSDMTGVVSRRIFEKPLADLAARWTDRVGKINIEELISIEPQANPIYYFLAKSLEELIVEIRSKTDHTVEDLLTSNRSGWYPIKKITWKWENVLTKCLEREYFFIFKLLKHFDLDSESAKRPFDYTVKLFEGPKQRSTWKQLVRGTKKIFGYQEATENSLNIADEKYAWYCLLDDVLYHILPSEYKFDCFEKIIQGYRDFLIKAGCDQLETLRVMTHNTARLIVQSMTYVEQTDISSIDGQILQKQLDLINTKAIQHSLASNSFRDLVDVFNVYCKNREDILTELCSKICLPEMTPLKMALLEIVLVALDKNVTAESVVSFFRSYSDLLMDLNDIKFDWYVKVFADADMSYLIKFKLIELVDNKLAATPNETYRVTAVERFAKAVPALFELCSCPKHYILEILLTLLSYIKNQLMKTSWQSGDQLSEEEQISTTNELIFAVRNSFLYLSEQPEYVSFEMFYDERVKPFASAVNNSSSHRDFTNRITLIKESFWYIRKQSEMAIDQALELFDDLNSESDRELLLATYQKYDGSFQRFMNLYSVENTTVTQIVNKVLELSFKKLHTTWDSEDKSEKVPEVLAGLAAVWSIIVSKDVSSTGKYLTPHGIQILCILRLFSVDRATEGVINHLAQVLTGQGKSLILGLMAALLALTGHRPRVVCYNEYLVTRANESLSNSSPHLGSDIQLFTVPLLTWRTF